MARVGKRQEARGNRVFRFKKTYCCKTDVLPTQTKAILAIKKAFDDADINIPYPIRTLYFYDQEKYNDYLPENAKDASSGNG